MLVLQHIGTEAFVGEALDGVGKGVLGGFEIDEIGFGRCMSDWVVRGDFVRMLESSQSPEPRLYLFFFHAWGKTEILIEISRLP